MKKRKATELVAFRIKMNISLRIKSLKVADDVAEDVANDGAKQ
jgi:hypothetical protein